jgi:hypothetical protein
MTARRSRRLPELDREAVIAAHSGLCPLCCGFIVSGRSKVAALRPPLRPSTAHVHYRPHRAGRRDKGEWVNSSDGRPIAVKPRRFAHELCARRHARDIVGLRPRDVAAARTAALVAHKAAVQEHCDG